MGAEIKTIYSEIETRRIQIEAVIDRQDYFVFQQVDLGFKRSGLGKCSPVIVHDQDLSGGKMKIQLPMIGETGVYLKVVDMALAHRKAVRPHISDERELNTLVAENIKAICEVLTYKNRAKNKNNSSPNGIGY